MDGVGEIASRVERPTSLDARKEKGDRQLMRAPASQRAYAERGDPLRS
jgi:hypothetical protein